MFAALPGSRSRPATRLPPCGVVLFPAASARARVRRCHRFALAVGHVPALRCAVCDRRGARPLRRFRLAARRPPGGAALVEAVRNCGRPSIGRSGPGPQSPARRWARMPARGHRGDAFLPFSVQRREPRGLSIGHAPWDVLSDLVHGDRFGSGCTCGRSCSPPSSVRRLPCRTRAAATGGAVGRDLDCSSVTRSARSRCCSRYDPARPRRTRCSRSRRALVAGAGVLRRAGAGHLRAAGDAGRRSE